MWWIESNHPTAFCTDDFHKTCIPYPKRKLTFVKVLYYTIIWTLVYIALILHSPCKTNKEFAVTLRKSGCFGAFLQGWKSFIQNKFTFKAQSSIYCTNSTLAWMPLNRVTWNCQWAHSYGKPDNSGENSNGTFHPSGTFPKTKWYLSRCYLFPVFTETT